MEEYHDNEKNDGKNIKRSRIEDIIPKKKTKSFDLVRLHENPLIDHMNQEIINSEQEDPPTSSSRNKNYQIMLS
jgi:hypothetical protein